MVTDDKHAETPIGYSGLSTDVKPTANVPNGSTFLEMDTSSVFAFDKDGNDWREL